MKRIQSVLINSKGLTVVELLIAVAILAVIVGGGYAVMANGYKLVDNSQEKTEDRYTEKEMQFKSKDVEDTIVLERLDNEDGNDNCIVYDGSEEEWGKIRAWLIEKGTIPNTTELPQNTKIVIKGNLTTDGNNSNKGKNIEGTDENSTKIYVEGDFTLLHGDKIENTSVYVNGNFHHGGEIKPGAIVYVRTEDNHKITKEGNSKGKVETKEYSPSCGNGGSRNDNEEPNENESEPVEYDAEYSGNDKIWSDIWYDLKGELGLKESTVIVPANTVLKINGDLVINCNNGNGKCLDYGKAKHNNGNYKNMSGANKDTVKIYVEGDFTIPHGSTVNGVSFYVKGSINNLSGGKVLDAKVFKYTDGEYIKDDVTE